jgi:hypothetical protein
VSSLARQKFAHVVLGVYVIATACGCDALIESLMEGSPLLGVEPVVAIANGSVYRLQVCDLAFRQVRGLVEHESAVLNVGAKGRHLPVL